LISGRVRVLSPDGNFIAMPGDVIDIEPYAEHQIEALEDSYFIEVFGPGRSIIEPKID
jgi:quercetin dioxygenase-like cupin family protein